MYLSKYPGSDVPSVINGHHVASTSDLLSQVPWQLLSDGIPCFTHGDLQFDNILFDKESQTFLLLDWRQDFGGYIEFGDLYYDLAKLYGGIVLNYDYIKLNLLNYSEDSNTIFFDFAQRFQSTEYLTAFESFCSKKGFNIQKIKIIVSLIYLNMSPLHHYPFDKLLYSLGRYILSKELSNYHQSL
jgi:thiamine kinase-like enzyme